MFFLLLEIFIPFQVLAHVGPALSYVLSRFEASADFEPETFGPAAASSRATADSIDLAFSNTCSYPRQQGSKASKDRWQLLVNL